MPATEQEGVRQARHGWQGLWPAVWTASAVTALAALLRFCGLRREGLWLDEAISVQIAQRGAEDFWKTISGYEANMGGYYLALRGWMALGDGEAVVRSLSALAGVLAVPAMFVLGRRLFGTAAGTLAALLLAVNEFHVRYSQEARSYALVVLFALLSWLLLVRALERGGRWNWVGYVGAVVLGAYAHVFVLLLVPAQACGVWAGGRGRRPWRALVLSWLSVAVLTAPLVWCLTHHENGQLKWVPAARLADVYWVCTALAGSRAVSWVCFAGVAAAVGVLAARWRSRNDDELPGRLALVLCWLVVPLAGAFVVSLRHPVFMDRYLIECLPALLLLAAWALTVVRPRWLMGLLTALVLVGAGRSLHVYYGTAAKEDWRGAEAAVAAQAAPGDGMVFLIGAGSDPFTYYARRGGHADLMAKTVYPEQRNEAWTPAPEPAAMERAAEQHRRMWLIESHVSTTRAEHDPAAVEAALGRVYATASVREFRGVRVVLYARRREP